MGFKLGLSAVLQYDAAGDIGTPTWAAADNVEEVTLNLEENDGEVKNRASDWAKSLVGKKVASIEVTMTADPGAPDYVAFRTAFMSGADIAVAATSDAILNSGAEGLMMDAKVMSFNRSEGLEDPQKVTFTLKPSAESTNEPSWAVTP